METENTDPESRLLGLSSNKEADEFSVVVPEMKPNVTKRKLLSNLASIYDPLGLVATVTLKGKTIYRETCNSMGCITSGTTSSRIWSMGEGNA